MRLIHPALAHPLRQKLLLPVLLIAALALPASAPAAAEPSPHPAAGGPSDPHEVEAFVDGFFNREDIKPSLAGAVVAVVQGDEPLLVKGYGYADTERRTPVDPERTLFRIASITKTFTATAVMQLAEQGKVDLDRDIAGYLGGLTIPNRTGSPLTLKHLMTHTSGFDRTEAAEDEGAPNDTYPLEQYVKDHLPTVVRKPGEAYRYDNYAYDLLGYIVQNVAGEPFEEVVQDRILTPLGMKSSYLVLTPAIQSRLATPYDGDGGPLPLYSTYPNNSPDGGLMTTGADMTRFMVAELNGGKLGSSSILSERSLKRMQELSVSIHPDIPGVGYGFESSYPELSNGQYVIDKGGAATGYQSHLWLLPERRTGLFIALNSARNARTIQRQLFEAFMNRYYPAAENGKTDAPADPVRQTADQLARLEGIYRDLRMPMWHYEVEAVDGGLIVTDFYGVHRLTQEKELLFADGEGRKAAFKEDDQGRIAYFYYNKSDSWAERLPEPQRYDDVPPDHPYAKYIYYVRQQGLLEKEDGRYFKPEQPITRAQFVGQLMALADVPYSEEPVAFADAAGSPYAAEIETALEFGLVSGTPKGTFEPERAITRQEAAVILARALQLQFGAAGMPTQSAKLAGVTDAWARKAVETIVARGYYGPEVAKDDDGAVDYRSRKPMLRQEAAAMLYRFP